MSANDDAAWLQTLSESEIARTLELSAKGLAELAQTVARSPSSTIEPSRDSEDALGRHAIESLGDEHTGGIVGGLVLGATIGEGGMGLVRTATQRSLGRHVAVKTLRPEVRDEQATLRLLREAWVTGSLEHPNIVPVYDLGLGADGTPIIVLKHIEGSPWSDLVADAAAVRERFGADDLLEHNLRIFVQVCNAVSLAHARGVLHRDLKPENVMIGRFGEVYLVDWGIAVSLRDDPTGRMPLASLATEMAGTPAYMAPEMLGGAGRLSERTDVYLLGAVLHEILVGRPPHVGGGFREIVVSILRSELRFPAHVPAELAAIAARAMSRTPEDRFASVEELRQKVEWYLRHRGSLALSAEAARRVDEMRAALEGGGDPDALRDRVHHLFAEARFGFRQAIRACDDNDAARTGLRDATELVVVYELERGAAEAAAAALAELDDPPPELTKRVADAMRAREGDRRRVAQLERLSAELDPSTGRRTRLAVSAAMGAMWTINPEIVGFVFRRWPAFPHWMMYVVTMAIIATAGAVVFWGRESLWKTAVNRRTLAIAMLMFASQLVLQVGARLLLLPYVILWPLHLYCWFVAVSAFAILVDRRLWPSVIVFLASFLFAAALPQHCFHAMSVANFVLLVNLLVAWSRPQEDGGFFIQRVRERRQMRGSDRRGLSSR